MIQDDKNVFSDGQSVVVSISTLESTDIIDWGKADPNAGYGHPLWLTVTVNTSLSGQTSATTFTTKVQDATDGSSWTTTLFQTSAMVVDGTGQIAAGTKLIHQPLPAVFRRYMRVAYIVAGASITSGTVDAYIHLGGEP